MSALQITIFAKSDGPLTKQIYLDKDDSLKSDGSACVMTAGTARRLEFTSMWEYAQQISALKSNEALATGSLREDLPDQVAVVTKNRLNGATPPGIIARTQDYIDYRPGEPAPALIDFDIKAMPPAVAARLAELGGFWSALVSILPELVAVARVKRASTSAGLFRADTGEEFPGSGGVHVYLLVKDGTDIERFLKALHARCWLAGLGWVMVGAGGQLLERSVIDRSVGAGERLVFEGPPILDPPLAQDEKRRRPISREGQALDTLFACPPLTITEEARLTELRAKEAYRLAPERAKAREAFIARRSSRLAAKIGIDLARARKIVERQRDGVLLPDIELPFDDDELAGKTVADVLADPDRFEGATLADPLEGIQYGRGKARIMRRADGAPWIHSFAHGRAVYELKLDYRAAKAAIERAPQDDTDETFIRLVLDGDLDNDEVEDLRNLASDRSGITKTALGRKLKNARQAASAGRAQQERDRRLAERQDPRPQIRAPRPDAPWSPEMGVLNQVLREATEPEPPMRNIDGVVVQVRVRPTLNMHVFTALGANNEETEEKPLPPPEQPLLTRLSEPQLAELIERYIDYIDEAGRSVHLGNPFVHHFHTRPDDQALPLVVAIATLPIVLDDGTLLAGRGLDRDRDIVFRVPPELLAILPNKADCKPSAVAEAMRFLTDDWLCDVATDYPGKCVLITAALTVIERSLLPDRPTFWITAGRRGGGKTTTIIMLLMAVTGIRAAAAAWSPNEEERRKALLAYLLEALAAIIWDNIPRGAQISCPHIERSCTSAFYSDRKLGVSETVTASAAIIHFFTGNNIGPRGDLASRGLHVRLEVDRPDPENRSFRHPDPIGWTEGNRGRILSALYTILLGNPRRSPGEHSAPETRFKTWWEMIGSGVEFAAQQHKEHVDALVMDAKANCLPTPVRLKDLFLVQEAEDEESSSLADVLAVLAEKWPEKARFQAADVAEIINTTGESATVEMRERSATLREFFFPDIPALQAVTAKGTSKRLKKHLGEAVARDERTLILKDELDTHTKVLSFYVVRTE